MWYVPLLCTWVINGLQLIHRKVNEKITFKLFFFTFLIMTIMSMFRYGSGKDYCNYETYYYQGFAAYHVEIFWKFLWGIMNQIGFDYEFFVAIDALFIMGCYYKFIIRYSSNYMMSLILLIPTFWWEYVNNALRMGTAIAIFAAFIIPLLQKKKWIKYYICVCLLLLVHTSAVSLLVLPIFMKLFRKERDLIGVVIVSLTIATVLWFLPSSLFSFLPADYYNVYILNKSISITGLIERSVWFFLIFLLMNTNKNLRDQNLMNWFRIYTFAYCLGLIFLPWNVFSERFAWLFRIVEVILIPLLLQSTKKWRQLLILFIMLLSVVMMTRRINFEISTFQLYQYNAITYPWQNIFQKE